MRFNSSMAGSTVEFGSGWLGFRHWCSLCITEWTRLVGSHSDLLCTGCRTSTDATMAQLPGAPQRAVSGYCACLVESGRVTRRAPPLEIIRVIRPPSHPSTGLTAGGRRWLASSLHSAPHSPAATSFPKCNSRARCRYRVRARPSTSKAPMARSAAPSACALSRKLADYRRHRHCSTITSPPCATSAHRRCSPATHVDLLIDGPRTYRAMFAAIEKARDYVLVESFIFEEAAAGDRTLSALLRAGRRPRRAASTCCTTPSGSLTTDAQFLDGLKRRRHRAVRLQSAESAR